MYHRTASCTRFACLWGGVASCPVSSPGKSTLGKGWGAWGKHDGNAFSHFATKRLGPPARGEGFPFPPNRQQVAPAGPKNGNALHTGPREGGGDEPEDGQREQGLPGIFVTCPQVAAFLGLFAGDTAQALFQHRDIGLEGFALLIIEQRKLPRRLHDLKLGADGGSQFVHDGLEAGDLLIGPAFHAAGQRFQPFIAAGLQCLIECGGRARPQVVAQALLQFLTARHGGLLYGVAPEGFQLLNAHAGKAPVADAPAGHDHFLENALTGAADDDDAAEGHHDGVRQKG